MPASSALKGKQERDKQEERSSASPDIQNGRRAVLSSAVPSCSIQQLQIPLCSTRWAAIQEKLRDYTSIFVLELAAKARKLLRLLSYNIGVNGPINWLDVDVGGPAKWGVRLGWLAGLEGEGGGAGTGEARQIKYDSGKCNNVP